MCKDTKKYLFLQRFADFFNISRKKLSEIWKKIVYLQKI